MTNAPLKARLVAIRYAADATLLFDLVPLGGVPPDGIEPGAHVDITLANGLVRQYSLCNKPAERDRYVIGVKLDRNSRGGSAYMHQELRVGTVLDISAPRNHFALDVAASHTVLI